LPTKFQGLHPNSEKLCYKTREGLWNFSKISSSQNYSYSLPFFQKYHNHPIYSPSFHHLLRLIIFFPPRKVVKINFLKIQIENYVQKREPKIIQISAFNEKKKEVKENPNLVANGRFKLLVANGRFQCLVAFRRRRIIILFTSSHFAPNKFYLNLFFSIDFKALFYHGFKLLLMHFLPFLWPINYNHTFNVTSLPHIHRWFDFDWIFFPFFEFMVSRIPHLTGLKLHKWMRNYLENHP